jgi:hypothetical protein
LFFLGSFGFIYGFYKIIKKYNPEMLVDVHVPIKNTYYDIIMLFLVLGCTNPFLEEFFWRVFSNLKFITERLKIIWKLRKIQNDDFHLIQFVPLFNFLLF